MEQVGINSNVYAGGKIFHIQTAGSYNDLVVQSEIFEAGRIISVQKKRITDVTEMPEDDFREFVKKYHHEVAWEVELMFFMREKIRNTTHTVSNSKIGLLFLRKGFLDEAISEFQHTIEHDPDLVEVYNHLGLAYLHRGDFSLAIESIQKGIELRPQFPDLRNNLGFAYGKAKKYSEAITEYDKALAINPHYVVVHLNKAITFLESILNNGDTGSLPTVQDRILTVSSIFKTTLMTNPDFANYRFYTFRFEKILKHLTASAYVQAIDIILEVKESIQKPSLDETIHGFYLKFLFGGAGKDEKVINDYRAQLEQHINENPTYADLHNSLGLVYLIQCRNLFLKAMSQFKKAYEINPSYKTAYKNFRLVQNDGREFLNLLRAILK
ncbi:MAG TPA: tetratricopeptide repeat protein [bacterium]|nr:tetratricopeptide repeat protein [bacterium]HMZ03999.1 tetratricopeptide repeat protein [bacterium]HNB09600.1 tetratricopeptide repeat protein [bacterium]HND77245.1 tetratricopeptide repeat protein [bacterium]HNE83345.1 tetratricopeptide repeat protein [bacterium]